MSTGAPFIGSKISLISKAEIRYEGILYQVDTKESTVTLAKVRSFGTENRPSTKHIPPRSEVYEFIIFRGSDIKDLNVSEMPDEPNSPPQDPAILSAQSSAPLLTTSVSPSMASSSQPSVAVHRPPPVPQGAHPHYYPHPPAAGMGSYSPFGMQYYRQPMMMGPGAGRPHPVPPGVPQPHPPAPAEGVVSHGQPQTPAVPPHVSVIGVAPPQPQTPPRSLPSATATESANLVATPTYAPASGEVKPQASSTPVVSLAESSQPVLPLAPPTTVHAQSNHTEELPAPPQQQQQLQQPSSAPPHGTNPEKKEKGGRSERRDRNEYTDTRRQQGQAKWERGGRGNYHSDNRGNRGNYRGRRDNRGGGGGRGGYSYYRQQQQSNRGGYRQQQQPNSNSEAKPPPFKYDSDFDFESANARFKKESLEEEFKEKLRVDSSSRKTSESCGEGAEGSGSDEEDVVIVEEVEEEEEFYDKSKSFFDNISCESSSNKKFSRSAERGMNMETFGVSSVNQGYGYRNRRGRGRGRGGYRGRGRYGGGGSDNRHGDREGGWGNRREGEGGWGNRRDGEGGWGNRREGGEGWGNRRGGRYNNRDYRQQNHHNPAEQPEA